MNRDDEFPVTLGCDFFLDFMAPRIILAAVTSPKIHTFSNTHIACSLKEHFSLVITSIPCQLNESKLSTTTPLSERTRTSFSLR